MGDVLALTVSRSALPDVRLGYTGKDLRTDEQHKLPHLRGVRTKCSWVMVYGRAW